MLNSLSIKNVAVIDNIEIDMSGGLSVLTGETGAGKSIIIDSINMILGARGDRELVRHDTSKAVVQAVFEADDSICDILSDNDIDYEDNQIIITRSITSDGKSIARINGCVVPLGILRDISNRLVNIHGQHDNQSLLTPSKHIDFLDEYAKDNEILLSYQKLFMKLKALKQQLNKLNMNEQDRLQRISLLEYQINEINSASLTVEEEEELLLRRDICANAEKITSSINTACMSLYENEDGQSAYDGISIAVNALSDIADINPELQNTYNSLSETMYLIQDTAHELKNMLESVEYSEEELDQIEERLDTISKLKRKYGSTVQKVIEFGHMAENELNSINLNDEQKEQINIEIAKTEQLLKEEGSKLTKTRVKSAKKLQEKIQTSLHELNMEASLFEVNIISIENFFENGMDTVEFRISTNPGEPLKPLIKIASGGELSRVMLAIKSVLADSDKVDTLIFDEIDTGVSGAAALKIAEKLKQIAQYKQVLCITHLPQLAAKADNHFLITKAIKNNGAYTSVNLLDNEGRITELSRIIDGGKESNFSREHAKEMLNL